MHLPLRRTPYASIGNFVVYIDVKFFAPDQPRKRLDCLTISRVWIAARLLALAHPNDNK